MQGDGVRELLAAAREMGCDYLENEPMRLHTTFKIGGPARVLLFDAASGERLGLGNGNAAVKDNVAHFKSR